MSPERVHDFAIDLEGGAVADVLGKGDLLRDILPALEVLRAHRPETLLVVAVKIDVPPIADLEKRRPFHPESFVREGFLGDRPRAAHLGRGRHPKVLGRRMTGLVPQNHNEASAFMDDGRVNDVEAGFVE